MAIAQIGTIREGGLYMPIDEATQVSKGFAFIEFSTPQARRLSSHFVACPSLVLLRNQHLPHCITSWLPASRNLPCSCLFRR